MIRRPSLIRFLIQGRIYFTNKLLNSFFKGYFVNLFWVFCFFLCAVFILDYVCWLSLSVSHWLNTFLWSIDMGYISKKRLQCIWHWLIVVFLDKNQNYYVYLCFIIASIYFSAILFKSIRVLKIVYKWYVKFCCLFRWMLTVFCILNRRSDCNSYFALNELESSWRQSQPIWLIYW